MIRNKDIQSIVKGIQEKKGRRIRVVDLRKIDESICNFMVVCEGNSPNQVAAISDSVEECARKERKLKPGFIDGLSNGVWVVMDYYDIIVHIFLPEERAFYDIENLWEDGKIEEIADED